ncbi:uncharacterized protein PRCAT00004942001 [Priceomyces carsonii]|uniref:uncharacterized protein n=1 Tax=Priceomyces carsonii TaxID=28549 RepID=UPI002ED9C889|nr:unnamed protein product [Priceomyces carsonii]
MSLLGSNNSNSAFGQPKRIARSSSFIGAPGNSLFGSSNLTASSNQTSGGLFGASNSNNTSSGFNLNNTSTSGSLFGNSNSSKPTTGPLGSSGTTDGTTGLFGSSNNNDSASTGGLFGSSNKPTFSGTGLFGGPNSGSNSGANLNVNNTSSGLFGSSGSNANTGLFNNTNNSLKSSNVPNSTNTLFSSNNKIGTNNTTTGTGLFGNSNTTSFGSGPSGASIFSSNQSQQPQQNNVFGSSVNQNLSYNENPYNFNQVFASFKGALDKMPASITEDIPLEYNKRSHLENKKKMIDSGRQEALNLPKSTLLNKLGRALKFFRGSNSISKESSAKGIFTQTGYLKLKGKKTLPKAAPKTISKPTIRRNVDPQHIDSVKRLIIRSEPLKFHLIDADKVLDSKRKRIVIQNKPTSALNDAYSSGDDSDHIERGTNFRISSRFPYTASGGQISEEQNQDGTTFEGESFKSNVPEINLDNTSINNGYWCTPTIKELISMKEEELKNVENFIVGRIKYGQVAFNHPVDLSQILTQAQRKGITLNKELFEETVSIRQKVLEVYKDDRTKPPIGFGLNVPATITLENIEPRKGTSASSYIKFLQGQVGMEFVTYDPMTHVWVFKVKHFSIWGLAEDEDNTSGESNDSNLKRKQEGLEHANSLSYSKLYKNDKINQELKKQKLSNETKGLPGGWTYDDTQGSPLNIKRGLVANEIEKQIDLYKHEMTANELGANLSDITIESSGTEELDNDDILSNNPSLNSNRFDYLKQLVSVLPKDVNLNDIIEEKAYEPEILNDALFDNIKMKPNLAVSDDWLIQLELTNDINSSLSRFVFDSTREPKEITIKNVDEALFSNFNSASKESNCAPEIEQKPQSLITDWYEEQKPQTISSTIYRLLYSSKIDQRVNGYPKVQNDSNISFDSLLVEGLGDEDSNIIRLLSALFDLPKEEFKEVDQSDDQLINHLKELKMKSLFLDWLKKYNELSITQLSAEESSDPLKTVFVNICAGNLKSAVTASLAQNSPHLSVILTLLDSNDLISKSIADGQLKSWNEKSILKYIPETVVKVYQILSGNLHEVVSSLPWNIALALRLNYGAVETKLKDLIKESFPHFDDSPVTEVLRLYYQAENEGMDKAMGSLEASRLNVKFKWFVNKVISHGVSSKMNDTISRSFGNFLTNKGLWKEAIYVYSHLNNDDSAASAIREIVVSNIKNIKDESKDIDEIPFLSSVLMVPQPLIYEAVALNKHSLSSYWEECEAFIVAKLWEKSHKVIVDHLGPSTVISNNRESISRLKSILSLFPERGLIIPDWNTGAGIYEKWCQLEDDENDTASIEFLLSNIPMSKAPSTQSNIALSIISKKVGDFALDNHANISGLKEKVLSLHLGENETNYFKLRLAAV